jgi:3-methylcrotonyl-CoA carboxylase alpha subunit
VTEEITGQDLVEWQLRVASGEKLPKTQDQLSITGHAIEARLYAEDPAKGFLPSVGKLAYFELPERLARIDSGVEPGDAITPYYDPMIAKIIVRESDRHQAIESLWEACTDVEVWPVRTNAEFLGLICLDKDFRSGNIDTGLIGRKIDDLQGNATAPDQVWQAAANFWVLQQGEGNERLRGFRLNGSVNRRVTLEHAGEVRELTADWECAWHGFASRLGDALLVFWYGQAYSFSLPGRDGLVAGHGVHDGEIEAPMPGRVTAVEVAAGDKVTKGQRLLTLEAMKMEHALVAPFDGTVAELNAAPGQQVSEGAVLVKVELAE